MNVEIGLICEVRAIHYIGSYQLNEIVFHCLSGNVFHCIEHFHTKKIVQIH